MSHLTAGPLSQNTAKPENQRTLEGHYQEGKYVLLFWHENYVCVCIPILVTMLPEWLSRTEPLPHTPGTVRPSWLCL